MKNTKIEKIEQLIKDNQRTVSYAKNLNSGNVCELLLKIIAIVEEEV